MESWSLKWQHVDTRCSFLPRRNSVLAISRPASWSRKSRVSESPSGLLAVVNVALGGSCTRVHLPTFLYVVSGTHSGDSGCVGVLRS